MSSRKMIIAKSRLIFIISRYRLTFLKTQQRTSGKTPEAGYSSLCLAGERFGKIPSGSLQINAINMRSTETHPLMKAGGCGDLTLS